jgi:UDP-N-acetylglucosamine 2-epimerase (non-hydrolysing)
MAHTAKTGVKQITVMAVIGTRPEAIKIAPVVAALNRQPGKFQTIVAATGQHRELLDQTLAIFRIKPHVDLNLMRSHQGLPSLTARVLESMSGIFARTKPDIVLVQGDTTTVFAAALAAFYEKVPVAHIEAGLRTYNKYSPFPEETNRRLTTAMADIHFAPTLSAKVALLKEGVAADKIIVTGNTVVDALMQVLQLPFSFRNTSLKNLDFRKYRLVLATSHRRESFGPELENICLALKHIVMKYQDIVVVYPVHPNPVVKNTTQKILGGVGRIYLVDPLDYLTFVNLMKKSYMILTDSGGLQEEAPTLKKPLLLLRNVTERPESFQAGTSKVIGTDRRRIVEEAENILNNKKVYDKMKLKDNPYGDGRAAHRIVKALSLWAKGKKPLIAPFEEFDALPA